MTGAARPPVAGRIAGRIAGQVAEVYRDLSRRGLVVGSSGNVSARLAPDGAEGDDARGGGAEGMLITPTGISGDAVRPDALVAMTLDGAWQGPLAPSSEWEMHAAIYRAAPEARVIVHTHSDHATALACLNLPLPAFHYGVAEFGGEDVRCAPYATFGTPALAALAADAIARRTACLLANHGMICHGRDAESALLCAIRLETLCRQYLLARAAGTPRLLTRSEMDAARERYRDYGRQPSLSPA